MERKNPDKKPFDELILRVKTIEEVLGSQALYANPAGFNKKTVEKWLRADSYPRPASLQAFCALAGITVAQFEAPQEEFARALAKASAKLMEQGRIHHAFDEKQIADVIGSLQKGGGLMAVLSETIRSIGRKTLEKYQKEFSGHYMGYIHWTRWEEREGQAARLAGGDFKFLVRVGEVSQEHPVILAWLTTHHHLSRRKGPSESKWAYQGAVVPLPGKLVFLFEVPDPSFEEMGFLFIICQNTPKDRLLGILCSDSSSPEDAPFVKVQPMPAAARVLLQKMEESDEDLLMERLAPDQSIDEKILDQIKNSIHSGTGILMPHGLPA